MKKGVTTVLYDCIIVLKTGEIIHLSHVRLISWTSSRVIITDNDDHSVMYVSGMIKDCTLTREG